MGTLDVSAYGWTASRQGKRLEWPACAGRRDRHIVALSSTANLAKGTPHCNTTLTRPQPHKRGYRCNL